MNVDARGLVGRTVVARVALAVGTVCAVVSMLALCSAPALAGFTHKLVGEFGSFSGSIGVAVEQFSGDVYVVDSNANTVRKFDSAGNPVAGWELGAMTGPSASGLNFPYGAAVDQTTGDLYVADFNNGAVDKFDANGVFLLSFTGSATPAGSFGPAGLATDSSGDVYVADMTNGVLDKFDSTGEYLGTFAAEGHLSNTNGVAVDASGNIYATANFNELIELEPSGNCVNSCTPIDQNGSAGVAVDPVSGHVYSADKGSIAEYDSTGTFIDRFGEGHLSSTFGVVVNGTLGQVYASNYGSSVADIFGPTVVIPDVTTGPATNLTTTGATLTGTVNPDGVQVSSCAFEIVIRGIEGTPVTETVPCATNPGLGTSPVEVNANVSGLRPNTLYPYRLVASNENGTVSGARESFTTLSPPLIDEQWVTSVSDSTATLNAKINPKGQATVYQLEYGTDTNYGTKIPVSPEAIGSGSEDVQVSRSVVELQAQTIYHYRVVATNASGTTDGPDRTFKTFPVPTVTADTCPNAQIRGLQAAQFLPDCRAYEMVSPPEKEGADISASASNTRVSTDGDAVQYLSLAGFGDAYGSGALGTEYVAERGEEGWLTHAVTPPQHPPFLPLDNAHYEGDFSSDLNTGVFYAVSPLTIDPNVANVPNIYLRTDLLKAGYGSYRLLSGCSLCESEKAPLQWNRPFFERIEFDPGLAGATADFSHVIFESTYNLAAGATGTGIKLYENANGTVRLAGILPDSACETPPCAAQESAAGQGAIRLDSRERGVGMYTQNTISTDGSRIVFTANPLIQEFAGLQGPSFQGNLYLREGGRTTVQLNASERSVADPNGWQPAMFMGASRDDSKIFFKTAQALTDEDTDPQREITGKLAVDIYMYDVNAPAGKHLTLVSRDQVPSDDHDGSPHAEYVHAVSADGKYVYFSTRNVLAPGATSFGGHRNLYVWHDGEVRYVAGDGNGSTSQTTNWGEQGLIVGWHLDEFRVTLDGKHALFVTNEPRLAESVGYDNYAGSSSRCEYGYCHEVYLYDFERDGLTCVSCDASGERPVGDAKFMSNSPDTSSVATTQHLNNALSEDGSRVFFDTSDALVRSDTNGKRDVYEYDARTGRVALISSGRSSEDSLFVEATPSGSDVLFTTSERLVRSEIDGNFDLYDARVDGGIAAQNVAGAVSCESEDCQGPAKVAPVFSLPSSLTFSGNGNPASSPRSALAGRVKGVSRALRLRRALHACRRKHGRGRVVCERLARRRFGLVRSSVGRVNRVHGR